MLPIFFMYAPAWFSSRFLAGSDARRRQLMKAWIVAAAVLLMLPAPSAAQAQLTAADIQRLQDNVFDAAADVSRLRQRDARLAESLETELDELRDEVIYLKVKMRKSGATRSEYADLR